MSRIGPFELILVLLIALVVFGPSKLPQIGRSFGEAIKEFKRGINDVTGEIDDITDDKPQSDKKA